MTTEQLRERLEQGMRGLLEYADAPWNMSTSQKKELVRRLNSVTQVRREIDGLISQAMPQGVGYERLIRLVDDFEHQLEALRQFGKPFLPAYAAAREFVPASEQMVQAMIEMAQEMPHAGGDSRAQARLFRMLDQMLELGKAVESAVDADIVSDAIKFDATRDLDSMKRLMCIAERLKKKSLAQASRSAASRPTRSPSPRPDASAGASRASTSDAEETPPQLPPPRLPPPQLPPPRLPPPRLPPPWLPPPWLPPPGLPPRRGAPVRGVSRD